MVVDPWRSTPAAIRSVILNLLITQQLSLSDLSYVFQWTFFFFFFLPVFEKCTIQNDQLSTSLEFLDLSARHNHEALKLTDVIELYPVKSYGSSGSYLALLSQWSWSSAAKLLPDLAVCTLAHCFHKVSSLIATQSTQVHRLEPCHASWGYVHPVLLHCTEARVRKWGWGSNKLGNEDWSSAGLTLAMV